MYSVGVYFYILLCTVVSKPHLDDKRKAHQSLGEDTFADSFNSKIASSPSGASFQLGCELHHKCHQLAEIREQNLDFPSLFFFFTSSNKRI